MDLTVLRNLTYGMYIISTKSNEVFVGCVVNTVTQITSSSQIISISINKDNYTNKILKETKKLSVSILSEKTSKETINTFGFYSSKEINKFNNVEYELINEIPVILDGSCGYLLGDVVNIVEVDTHDIFLVKLTDTKKLNENIPMTYDYYYTNLKGSSPKNAPTYIEEKNLDSEFNKYRCIICGHIYDDSKEEIKFEDLKDDWRCPVCGVTKDKFEKI